jgi:hypothetical protein
VRLAACCTDCQRSRTRSNQRSSLSITPDARAAGGARRLRRPSGF